MDIAFNNAFVFSYRCRHVPTRPRYWAVVLIFIFVLFIPIIAQSQTARYDIKKVSGIEPQKLNDKRQIAGNVGKNAARWEEDEVIQYPGLSSEYSRANCINNLGKMAGYSIDGSNVKHPVVFTNDTSIVLLAGASRHGGEALGINDFGEVVGTYVFCDTCRPSTRRRHAAFWREGEIFDIGTIEDAESGASAVNNWGLVVGTATEGSTFEARAFMTTGVGLTPLGALGGGWSSAYDVNENAMIVGASGETNSISRAVLWNPGIQNIQTLPGNLSRARAVNNSDQVVGEIQTPSGWKGFIWENGTMLLLDSLVHPDSGWVIERAVDINDSGDILALGKKNNIASYVILISGLTITRPSLNEKWIAGEKDTIKWVGGKKDQIVELKYSVDSGRTFDLIGYVHHADSGYYAWNVPKNIISKQCFISIMDFNDPSIVDTSEVFKIKPYILTRDSSGQYEPYRPQEDQWKFWNNQSDMWPPEWYQQFDYRGTDPFTGQSYLYAPAILSLSSASSFPDWVSWVRTFGVEACYLNTSFPPIYSPSAVFRWFAVSSSWIGSCFGIAASNALAFSYKDQFQAKYSSFPGFANPITVASDTAVKRVVNELFSHQFGNPSHQHRISKWRTVTPNQTLSELKAMFREDIASPRTLSFWNNNGSGGHNVLPYKLEQDAVMKHIYYLQIYDNALLTGLGTIRIDTLANSKKGSWTPLHAFIDWGGSNKFMLTIEASDYLNLATLPKRTGGYSSPFILSSEKLEIYTPINVNTRIKDAQGKVTGYSNGSVFDEIPDSVPLYYLNGSETPPYGYALPTASYSVSIDNFVSDTVKTFFFTGDRTFFYERFDVEPDQTDRLSFDGGVSVSNPDSQQKTIDLLAIVNETTQEKMAVFSSIALAPNDSIRIDHTDSSRIRLISYGTAKSYDLELNHVTRDGVGRFSHVNIPLAANTSHIIVPDWTNLTNTDLVVLVDNGNNGTMDDTLEIGNETTGAGEDHGSLTPQEYRLAQNYPNPFNSATIIRFDVPKTSQVTIKIYDMLGHEVKTLIDRTFEAGSHVTIWDGKNNRESPVASGVYVVRMQAGEFVGVKKLVLLR